MKNARTILVVILLAALALLAGNAALAESGSSAIVYEFTGYQFTDDSADLGAELVSVLEENADLMSMLFPNGMNDTATARTYRYTWTLNDALVLDDMHWKSGKTTFADGNGWNGPTCSYHGATIAEASAMLGKDVFTCTIAARDGSFEVDVLFRLKELAYGPTFNWDQVSQKYVYFTPGQSLTLTFDEPTYGGSVTAYYNLFRRVELDDDSSELFDVMLDQANPTFTFTPDAAFDGATLSMDVSFVTWENVRKSWPAPSDYILLDQTKNPIIMPEETEAWEDFYIASGETFTLEAPAATSGSGAAIEYVWYCDMPEGGTRTLGVTSQPQYVLTCEAAVDMGSYHCAVRYVGDTASELAYNKLFYCYIDSFSTGVDVEMQVIPKSIPVAESAPLPDPLGESLKSKGIATYGELFDHMDYVLYESRKLPIDVKMDDLAEFPMNLILVDQVGNEVTEGYFTYHESLTVYLPAPAGTNVHGYTFFGVHTHQMDDRLGNRFKAGDTEPLDVRIENGMLCFEVTSLSPVKLYALAKPAADIPTTGDNTPIAMLIALAALSLTVGCALFMRKKHA